MTRVNPDVRTDKVRYAEFNLSLKALKHRSLGRLGPNPKCIARRRPDCFNHGLRCFVENTMWT